MDSALYPYDRRDLLAGIHPSPISLPAKLQPVPSPGARTFGLEEKDNASVKQAVAPILSSIQSHLLNLLETEKIIEQSRKRLISMLAFYNKRPDEFDPVLLKKIDNYERSYNKIVDMVTGKIDVINGEQGCIKGVKGIVDAKSAELSIKKAKLSKDIGEYSDAVDEVNTSTVSGAIIYATDCMHSAEAAELQAAAALKQLDALFSFQPDPPMDGLLHSVQFVVTHGANVSPNWSFLVWKGPSVTTPGASATGQRTHILNIAIGSPREGDRLIQNQTVLSLASH